LNLNIQSWCNIEYLQHRKNHNSYFIYGGQYGLISADNDTSIFHLKLDTVHQTIKSQRIKILRPTSNVVYFPASNGSDWWVILLPEQGNEDKTAYTYKFTEDSIKLVRSYIDNTNYSTNLEQSVKVDKTRQDLFFVKDSIIRVHYNSFVFYSSLSRRSGHNRMRMYEIYLKNECLRLKLNEE